MKEKLVKWLKSLSFTLWFIIPYVLEHFFDINIREWLDKVPSSYYTIFLGSLLIYVLVRAFIKKVEVKEENQNQLCLPSINDYEKVSSAPVLLMVLIAGYIVYVIIVKVPDINPSLLVLIFITFGIDSCFLKKTAMFIKNEGLLMYNNGKETVNLLCDSLEEIRVFTDKVEFIYKDNDKKVIHHLEFKNNDYKNLKTWSNKHLPYVEVAKEYY